jgi:hypothetical protein
LADCDIDTAKEYIDSILSPSTPYELPEDRTTILTIVVQISSYARKLEDELAKTKSAISSSDFGAGSIIPRPVPFQCDMPRVKDEDAENDDMLSESLKRLNFGSFKSSFYGKGSNYMLLSTAIKAKEETDGRSVLAEDSARRPQYWSIFSVRFVYPFFCFRIYISCFQSGRIHLPNPLSFSSSRNQTWLCTSPLSILINSKSALECSIDLPLSELSLKDSIYMIALSDAFS